MKIQYWPLLMLLLAGCGSKSADANESAPLETKAEIVNEVESVVGIGRVEPELKLLSLNAEMPGRLVNIYAQAGTKVDSGTVLFELDHAENDAQMIQNQAQIRTQEAQVRQIAKSIEIAKINQSLAQKEYNRFLQAFQGNAETKSNLDKAENALELAKEQVAAQNLQLQAAQALRNELNAATILLRAQAENTKIRVLQAGTVLSVEVPLGTMVNTNTLLANFAPESPMAVVTEVDELFADKVKVGQKAEIRAQGGKETLATATVIFAAPFLRQKSLFSDEVGKLEDRRVREVKVRINNTKTDLLFGARVECVIYLK